MTNFEFTRLFRDPELLLRADLHELERIAGKYPYSANAHLLLAIRAELTGDPRRREFHERAASATFDRAHLYELLRELTLGHDEDPARQLEESLELMSLDELPTPTPITVEDLPSRVSAPLSREVPVPAPLPENIPAPDPIFASPAEPAPAAAPDSTELDSPEPPLDNVVEPTPQDMPGEQAPASLEEEMNAAPAIPEDPRKFIRRRPIGSREELRERLATIRKRQADGALEKDRSVKKIARRSLVESDGIISATLAEVFIGQGQYQHAIRIYEQLALANPEKRPIFAALIKDLKRKL